MLMFHIGNSCLRELTDYLHKNGESYPRYLYVNQVRDSTLKQVSDVLFLSLCFKIIG